MADNLQQENNALKARLSAFAGILRLGRDAFEQADLTAVAVHIVNNSKSLLAFDRSSLVDMRGRARVIAEFAQTDVNPNTEHAQAIRDLCSELTPGDSPLEIVPENPPKENLSAKARTAWEFLTADGVRLLVAPLRSARWEVSRTEPFLWVLEYRNPVPAHVSATLALLASDFGNALWQHTPQNGIKAAFRWFRKITVMRVFLVLLLLFLIAMFTLKVDHTVSAEFVVKPQEQVSAYAEFDAVVKQCYFNDGDKVKKGDVILRYDTDRMRFQLAAARAAFKETDAEYEQESKASFTDRDKLGKLKVLAHKREQAKVAIAEAEWYLAHSEVKALSNGVLALVDGSADKLSGRALRTGERLFDIFSGEGMIAEVMVNEKDASVLEKTPQITLFLHTRPELPIPVKLISERYYPELTEQNIYSYNLKVAMDNTIPGLRYGMRGVARVSGERINLGYYLFRSLVLWYRGL
ncbi:MAG: biotin/lipoyl-binding protein [Lentisphaeria bacterium]|nr:biotin/lipoyl-binding protein [Lentisphaeria bacterium]